MGETANKSVGRGRPSQGPKVGMVLAFTGHYTSARLLARFLELAGVSLVKSRITTPRVIEAGTTFASTDFCIPLRVYVGHVYNLIQNHPDLEYIVAPNILSEDGISSTCSKYRDIGGVAIRSLGDTVGYLSCHNPAGAAALARLIGPDALKEKRERAENLPTFIMPNIRSLDRTAMRNVCYDVYGDIMGWSKGRKTALFLAPGLKSRLAPDLQRLESTLEQAYREVIQDTGTKLQVLLNNGKKPRLALVGRRYLIHDSALSCDLKIWFQKKGVAVFTASDVPKEELQAAYEDTDGYYDTHKEGRAFIEWAVGKVDGFISLGSFGCHPDSFQVDFLAENIRAKGAPCWTFRYDESAGSAGFHTRYETILSFLEKRRDLRVAGKDADKDMDIAKDSDKPDGAPPKDSPIIAKRVSGRPGAFVEESQQDGKVRRDRPRKPLIIWPYMGEILNLLVEEICHQIGLGDYLFPPPPLSEESIILGNTRYTESCSPYACSTGTLVQSLRDALKSLEREAEEAGRPIEPHRVIMLSARGEGPCTFGWYAIVQNKHIPEDFREELARGDHTIEMATVGLDGFVDFVRDLCEMGDAKKLKPVLDYLEAWEKGFNNLPWVERTRLKFQLFSWIDKATRNAWAKLDAAEDLRARTLILRAHELEPGGVTGAYRQGVARLRHAHTEGEIARAHQEGMALLETVPRDHDLKPRVISVGEIYVALTSFGNRGTIENLLAREGVEVIEGVTLGGFIRESLKEMKRRGRRNHPLVRPLLQYLERRNIHLMEQKVRDPGARPFLVHEVGGDGLPSVGHARHHVEEGVDGIIHVYPFKCMPEGIAKDALKELADIYGVRYLSLSFDKEIEVERLRTEVSTFATLLHAQMARMGASAPDTYWHRKREEIARRKAVGRSITELYERYRQARHTD